MRSGIAVGVSLALVAVGHSQARPVPHLSRDERISALRSLLQIPHMYPSEKERREARFAVGFVDLDGDGVDEAIVYGPTGGLGSCGTGGCGIGIYVQRGRHYRLKCSTTIGAPPVSILRSRHHGWRDIAMAPGGGGGDEPPYRAVLTYNGSRYPLNPTVPPAMHMKGRPHEDVVIPWGPDMPDLPLYP